MTSWETRHDPEDPLADERDAALIRRLIEGPDDPRAALAALGDVDPTARAECEELLGLLESAGEHERQAIAAARFGDESILSVDEIRALSRRVVGPAAGQLSLARWAAAAVLLILALGIGSIFERGEAPAPLDPGPTLGNGLEAIGPLGPSSYERFEWSAQLVRGGWFEVVVYDAEDGSLVARQTDLEDTLWTPTSTEVWPDSIVWEVTVFDGDGMPADSGRFEASRLRR